MNAGSKRGGSVVQTESESKAEFEAGSRSGVGVGFREITEDEDGQRIDNYLIKILKGVPKSRIYKAVRSGEVRINGSRVKVSRRLNRGDRVRIPPIRVSNSNQQIEVPPKILDSIPVLYEDEYLMVVDKPAGLAVHGGTGIPYGLIEAFRQLKPESGYLELVHRIDKETSGCLMLAKSRQALLQLQQQLGTHRTIQKIYLALVKGVFHEKRKHVEFRLSKTTAPGEKKRIVVDSSGQQATSVISVVHRYQDATLIKINLKTGRMHQARVHCAAIGHPIAADSLYGDEAFNKQIKKAGLGRLFLHSHQLKISHPHSGQKLEVEAPLPNQLKRVLDNLI